MALRSFKKLLGVIVLFLNYGTEEKEFLSSF